MGYPYYHRRRYYPSDPWDDIYAAQACPSGYTTYTIRAGDTFYRLAQRYQVGLEELLAANPGLDPDDLRVGQQICVPERDTGPMPQCPAGWTLYTIRSGDTLYRIALDRGTTVRELLDANPGVDPNALRVGQRICVPGPMPGPEPRCPQGWTLYTIRSGDTLYRIAQERGTTVAELLRVNPGIDPNALRVGQRICVPAAGPGPMPQCPAGWTLYTIRSGDTLYRIAQERGTTVRALLDANPGVDPNSLRVGQRICVPGPECPTGYVPRTIRAGDTLYSIARELGTTVDDILDANPGLDPDALQVGQQICVPRGR